MDGNLGPLSSNEHVELRAFRTGDEERVLALHNRAFAGHAPRDRAHFDWRFARNPSGPPELSLAFAGDRCVGVCAGLPMRVLMRGEVVPACLHTDLAVDPDLRRGLAGGRLAMALCTDFTRRFVHGQKALEWSFPEPQLARITIQHHGMHVLRDVHVLALRRERAPAPESDIDVAVTSAVPADVDALWQHIAPEFDVATVRDARYLTWRYADHPDHAHAFVAARRRGELCALAVFREQGPDDRALTVMDWLVPRDDRESERALLARIADAAAARGRSHIAAWVPIATPQARRWQEDYGFVVVSTPFQECYRAWRPNTGRRWLAEHWYRSMGDFDFF